MNANIDKNKYATVGLHIALIVLVVLVAYCKLFNAGFMEWDDNEYVLHNKDIAGISAEHIQAWFTKFYIGNYQPITMVVYALTYLLSGVQPVGYHIVNLLLHTGNAVAVYILLTRLQPSRMVALFTALLFALHPSQTESVSWIAELKTVLCAFFYLIALVQYTSYVITPLRKKMVYVALLALAAMLCKGIAVALAPSLIAVDIWMKRDLKNRSIWLEKLPLFVLSVIIGIIAIKGQIAGRFLDMRPTISAIDTILYAAYAYVQYIVHFIVPYQLSVIYPYPKEVGIVQYIYFPVALGILALGYIAYRKQWYVLCGGILFYTVNIALVLQFLSFGDALMADRYLYIASIGILFPLVYYLFGWLERVSKKIVAVIVGGSLSMLFLVMTFLRNDIWLSNFNFYNAILDAFPTSAMAQYSVGGLYMRMGNYSEAETHMNLAVQYDPNNYKAWYNLGALYLREGKPAPSLEALNHSLSLYEYPKALFSRALLYQGTGRPDLALADAEKVLESQPQNGRAWYIKGDCLEKQGDMQGAITSYNNAIAHERDPLFFIRRGLALAKTKQNIPALQDLETAVAMNPKNGEAYYYRGVVKYRSGQAPCADFNEALARGYKQAQEAINKVCHTQ